MVVESEACERGLRWWRGLPPGWRKTSAVVAKASAGVAGYAGAGEEQERDRRHASSPGKAQAANPYRFHFRVSPHALAISSVEENPASSMKGSGETA